MSGLTISVITPSFNQGRFISRTIESVLSQGVPFDYQVIDGGSDDQTASVLACYQNQLTFLQEPDRGQAHAVNKGLVKARGDIIGWINSDDIYYPNALKTVLTYFAMHPEVDLVYGDANHIDEYDAIIENYSTEPFNLNRLYATCYLSQPAVFFRREVITRAGLLDETLHYCMDYEYWLRLASSNVKMAYIPRVLAGSRLHAATKTVSSPLRAHREALWMLYRKLGYVSVDWLLTYAITLAKHKTGRSKYHPLFMVTVLGIGFYSAIYWNGVWRGVKTYCLMIKRLIIRGRSCKNEMTS